jgi:HEAT repeat protein
VVRKGAVEALGQIGPAASASVPALLKKWQDTEEYEAMHQAAAKALKRIDPQAAKKAGIR